MNDCFLCTEGMSQLSELPGQDVGPMPPLFYCLGASLMILLCGFVGLSKPAWFCG